MDYVPWQNEDEDDSLAWLRYGRMPRLEPNEYLLSEGVSCKEWFPTDFVFDLEKTRGIKLADAIPNTEGLLVVSGKLKSLLESVPGAGPIEFLPCRVRNQKKQIVAEPYWVANVLRVISCMDAHRSRFRMNTIIKNQVARFYNLVLDPTKIPADAPLFRLGENTELILARMDLAQTIVREGCTGMKFVPLEYYGAEFRGVLDQQKS